MPSNMQNPNASLKVTVAATPTTATSAAFDVGLADAYSFVANVTTATGTSPTLDIVFLTSVDGGTTYVNMPLRSTQVTGAGAVWFTIAATLGRGELATESASATGVADTGGTLAKNCVFDPHHMKIKYTIGGTNPSFAFKLYAMAQPRTAGGY